MNNNYEMTNYTSVIIDENYIDNLNRTDDMFTLYEDKVNSVCEEYENNCSACLLEKICNSSIINNIPYKETIIIMYNHLLNIGI